MTWCFLGLVCLLCGKLLLYPCSKRDAVEVWLQVCAHIVQAIRKETSRVQEEWESALSGAPKSSKAASANDR